MTTNRTSLTMDHANVLAQRSGLLDLSNLSSVAPDALGALAQHQGHLILNEVRSLCMQLPLAALSAWNLKSSSRV
jgi:hypothetical protein